MVVLSPKNGLNFTFMANTLIQSKCLTDFNRLIIFSSQFINDNFDYDEHSALELLASYRLEEYLFQVAKVSRRLV